MKTLLAFLFAALAWVGFRTAPEPAYSPDAAIAIALATYRPVVAPFVPAVAPLPPELVAELPDGDCGCSYGGICRCEAAGGKCLCGLKRPCEICRTYAAARARAERERLPMIALVCRKDCPPCREMERRLAGVDFPGAVVVHLDADRDAPQVQALGITLFPSVAVSGPGPELRWKETLPGLVDVQRIKAALDAPLVSATPRMQVAPAMLSTGMVRGFSFGSC